jgi:hypothetical protein
VNASDSSACQDSLPEELSGAPQHSDGRLRLGVLFGLLKDATGYIQRRHHRFVAGREPPGPGSTKAEQSGTRKIAAARRLGVRTAPKRVEMSGRAPEVARESSGRRENDLAQLPAYW